MKKTVLICILILGLAFLTGCTGDKSLLQFVKEGGLETTGLVNLALASNGAKVTVSEDNPDHPGSTLNNGITSSKLWNQGEGWEYLFDGRFARGGYVSYGMEDQEVALERGFGESYDPGDMEWRGLRLQTGRGSVDTALGWVIIEFPEKKTVNRMVIYTIDSDEYPADKFGVRDMSIQYWNEVAGSWASVDRIGKGRGQIGNAVQNNESGVVTARFQPLETSKVRLAVRWTNDSKDYSRGRYTFANGTVRLLEVEVYGYEQEDVEDEMQVNVMSVAQDPNKVTEIGIVIDNYVDAYNQQNADMLMSSVSPDYFRDGETYSDLNKRMKSIFAKYEKLELKLEDVVIILTDEGAEATSTYTAQYIEAAHKGAPVTASGILDFQLSEATGYWKITRIDSR